MATISFCQIKGKNKENREIGRKKYEFVESLIHKDLTFWLLVLHFTHSAESSNIKDTLPNLEDFSRAIYTVDIGQNDIHFALTTMTEEKALASIPNIIDQFSMSIEVLILLKLKFFQCSIHKLKLNYIK